MQLLLLLRVFSFSEGVKWQHTALDWVDGIQFNELSDDTYEKIYVDIRTYVCTSTYIIYTYVNLIEFYVNLGVIIVRPETCIFTQRGLC